MVHGLLIQGYEEFFICRTAAAGQDAGHESVASMLASIDPQEWHHGFQVPARRNLPEVDCMMSWVMHALLRVLAEYCRAACSPFNRLPAASSVPDY